MLKLCIGRMKVGGSVVGMSEVCRRVENLEVSEM
jgi:hypothetical protein